MSDTIKSIAIATDSLGNYETRDIGADAINVDVSYDADGNVITDAETTVATKKSSAEAIKGINETLAADAEAINGKAPTSHASADTTYGIATSEKYGHVMLLDNISKIGVRTDIKENSGTGVSYRGMQNLVKDLKPLLSWSNDDSAPTRVPEVVLKPEDNDNVINYTYSFSFLSQLSEANAPDTIRLILDCGVETLPIMSSEDNTTSEILLTVGFANLDSGSNYYSYTLTEADKAYGYKYLESSTTTTTADDSGNSTETTTQTYTYRIDALLHKHVDVTSGEYSWSVEVVPNEKYLNNKCNEISAALDISSIPSDLGTTAGSAINALNTHLTKELDLLNIKSVSYDFNQSATIGDEVGFDLVNIGRPSHTVILGYRITGYVPYMANTYLGAYLDNWYFFHWNARETCTYSDTKFIFYYINI